MPTHPPADKVELGYYDYAAHLLALEVMRRGLPVEWLTRAYFITHHRGETVGFWSTRTSLTSSVAVHSTSRKDITRRLLERAGLTVATGRSFAADRRNRALAYGEKLGYPLVVKPVSGTKGQGVTTGIGQRHELEAAWEAAGDGATARVVERHFAGRDAGRFLVVSGRCVAVTQKLPPVLTGDGRRTVEELINERNAERATQPHLRKRLMVVDETLVAELARKNLTLSSVPAADDVIVLDQTANTSRGAETADITDDVHPSFADVAVRAAAAIPSLRLAGVDILADNLREPATPDNHIVVEINSRPGIRSHHFPDRGRPRDVARVIVDDVLNVTAPARAARVEVPQVPLQQPFSLSRLSRGVFARLRS